MLALEINNLSKVYNGTLKALDNVSFKVEKGKVFGLLGPNGAGKTTLIKSLLGIIQIQSGDAKMLGESIENPKIRERIGYLPENHKYPNFLTGQEVLFHFGSLSGVDKETLENRIPELLKLVSMDKWHGTKIKKYSKGMMQRIGLAQALINDPDLIFLDEPTDGIDPVGRREIHDILKDLSARGKTIFINSHMLAEIESVCDDVAILKQGKVIRSGSVEEITTEKERFVIQYEPNGTPMDSIISSYNYFEENDKTLIFELEGYSKLNELVDLLRKNDISLTSMNHVKNTLEDSFIKLVQE